MKYNIGNQFKFHLDWFNDENSGEERDEEGGEPLVGLVVAEHDAVRPEEKDGNANRRNAQGPSDKDAKPKYVKLFDLKNDFVRSKLSAPSSQYDLTLKQYWIFVLPSKMNRFYCIFVYLIKKMLKICPLESL